MMTQLIRVALLAALLAPTTLEAQVPTPGPRNTLVIFGSDTIRAELARTTEERQRGLMLREEVPYGTGMLFAFDRPSVQSIWMKDTYVPLDVAFLDASYRIVNIEALEPLDETIKQSSGPALFALEVPQGWFAEHGIAAGQQARIEFPPR
jgi:uncharacterized membrane protein (UPF0127 family)